MKKEYRNLAAPFLICIYIVSLILFIFLAITSYLTERNTSAIVFLVFSVLCFLGISINWMIVTINGDGIRYSCFFKRAVNIRWDEIQEVGIIGEAVFGKPGKKKSGGVKHIYFSKAVLDENKRFRLALCWPDKNVPYIRYTKDNIAFVSQFRKDFVEYNTRVL